MQLFLLCILPLIAVAILTQRNLLNAVIIMGVFSLLSSGIYFLMGAPDVAVAEGAIGVALATFIYVIALSDQGKLKVIAEEVPRFLFREGNQLKGIDYQILEGFAREIGLNLEVQFAPGEDLVSKLKGGEEDLIAGAFSHPDSGANNHLLLSTSYAKSDLLEIKRKEITEKPVGAVRREWISSEVQKSGKFIYFSTLLELYEAYQTGKISAMIIDSSRLEKLLTMIGERFKEEDMVTQIGHLEHKFALSSNRADLFEELELYLDQLRKSNQIKELTRKYLR